MTEKEHPLEKREQRRGGDLLDTDKFPENGRGGGAPLGGGTVYFLAVKRGGVYFRKVASLET